MTNAIAAAETEELTAVFRTVGQPTVTYVERESGALERELDNALSENGQLCLICGPSKTGKSTLYREVLRRRGEVALVVRCDRRLTAEGVWLRALEEVDFERVESRTKTSSLTGAMEGEVGAKLGWAWLAEATARLKGSLTNLKSDADVKKRVLAEPGSDLLIPVLKYLNYRLIIEDFHYLADEEKVILFEQWKRFTDNEVSVVVLGTTHRAVDIANSNKDLVGRITQINIGHWSSGDLRKVASQGFDYLKIVVDTSCLRTLANEAVGLPIIVQQACLALVTAGGGKYRSDVRGKSDLVNAKKIDSAFHNVAVKRYGQFEESYATLVKGPRERARKYKTYELVLGCFTLDPIKFSLHKSELITRIARLKISDEERPPEPSVKSTLSALTQFQHKRGLELLEWRPKQQMLHITEPAFLFYVRWRTLRSAGTSLTDIFSKIDFITVLQNIQYNSYSSVAANDIMGVEPSSDNVEEAGEPLIEGGNKKPD
jgi:hypothetical protein